MRLLRPVRSWRAIAARAYDVAEAMREGGVFPLQLYVLALFEDLRDNHRRASWDLRGLKRTRPPVLILRQVSRENGGIELIKAVSDVRSRRSELDPLLIVAGVAAVDAPLLDRGTDTGAPPPGPTPVPRCSPTPPACSNDCGTGTTNGPGTCAPTSPRAGPTPCPGCCA